jgi:hypothetical protein
LSRGTSCRDQEDCQGDAVNVLHTVIIGSWPWIGEEWALQLLGHTIPMADEIEEEDRRRNWEGVAEQNYEITKNPLLGY